MNNWYRLLATGAMIAPVAVQATQYMTVEAARVSAFPSASTFVDRSLTLTADQLGAVTSRAGVVPATPGLRVYEARTAGDRLGWAIVDQVIGKHELITFMVALDPTGAVLRVEILDYRENYGGEVRNPRWLRQFVGKRPGSAVKLDRDIQNISGATLSSRHVADGVRQVLAVYETILAHS